jgi:hypothetical protein
LLITLLQVNKTKDRNNYEYPRNQGSQTNNFCSVLAAILVFSAHIASPAPVLGQGTWETMLQARYLYGDGTTDSFCDTKLNITWLAAGANFNER